MKKKIFVLSIPMLPAENLKELQYRYSDGRLSVNTRFPGIALLEKYAPGKAPVKIVTVRTDDDNHRTEDCYRLFLEELDRLSGKLGTRFEIETEIVVPHTEDEEKSRHFLRELLDAYENSAYVYMDVTYGTKLTSIELFSSLFFAEICKHCSIKTAAYGKYAFDGSDIGELYDVTRLYHTLRFLETSAQMDKASFADLVDQMLSNSLEIIQ